MKKLGNDGNDFRHEKLLDLLHPFPTFPYDLSPFRPASRIQLVSIRIMKVVLCWKSFS